VGLSIGRCGGVGDCVGSGGGMHGRIDGRFGSWLAGWLAGVFLGVDFFICWLYLIPHIGEIKLA
jgi:uncharacterized membrane protein YkvI